MFFKNISTLIGVKFEEDVNNAKFFMPRRNHDNYYEMITHLNNSEQLCH